MFDAPWIPVWCKKCKFSVISIASTSKDWGNSSCKPTPMRHIPVSQRLRREWPLCNWNRAHNIWKRRILRKAGCWQYYRMKGTYTDSFENSMFSVLGGSFTFMYLPWTCLSYISFPYICRPWILTDNMPNSPPWMVLSSDDDSLTVTL